MRFQICHQMKVLLVLLELAHPTTNQLTLTHLNIWFDIDMIVINVLMFCVLSSWSLFRRQRHYITLLPINIHWQGFIERAACLSLDLKSLDQDWRKCLNVVNLGRHIFFTDLKFFIFFPSSVYISVCILFLLL